MTLAICYRCGARKFGAFTPCPDCDAVPQTEDDLAMSIAMTDHYFDETSLDRMSDALREGEPMTLDDTTKENLIAQIRESGVIDMLKKLTEPKDDEEK